MPENRNLEQKPRDNIDALLKQAGWVAQPAKKINLHAGAGQAVRKYQADVGPAGYVLFVGGKLVGVIEARREEIGQRLTARESRTEGYAAARAA